MLTNDLGFWSCSSDYEYCRCYERGDVEIRVVSDSDIPRCEMSCKVEVRVNYEIIHSEVKNLRMDDAAWEAELQRVSDEYDLGDEDGHESWYFTYCYGCGYGVMLSIKAGFLFYSKYLGDDDLGLCESYSYDELRCSEFGRPVVKDGIFGTFANAKDSYDKGAIDLFKDEFEYRGLSSIEDVIFEVIAVENGYPSIKEAKELQEVKEDYEDLRESLSDLKKAVSECWTLQRAVNVLGNDEAGSMLQERVEERTEEILEKITCL